MRVSGHDEVDADGLLTGPDGTWLDETATQATTDLAVWSVPRTRSCASGPGHYYWQAYLTGDAANGAEEPIGPVQELDVTLPYRRQGPRQRCSRSSAAAASKSFYLSSAGFPGSVAATRFQKVVKTAASRWGLKALRWTSAKAGVQDGFNVAGFSSSVDARRARRADRLRQARQASSRATSRSTPARTGTRARTIRRSTRSTSRASCCTSSATWRATRSTSARCTNSPMIEALGAGEWWRGARDKWFGDCAASASSVGRKTFVHRIVRSSISGARVSR